MMKPIKHTIMKNLLFAGMAVITLTLASCSNNDSPQQDDNTCSDGIQNNGETGIDCGGPNCLPCQVAATCNDGIQNGDETGVDCGGSSCPACETSGIVEITSSITSDATWTADNIYELQGRIYVTDGATLTIEPGTIIKAFAGSGANASTLIVARGGKMNAVGTASKPIIFTSVADNIELGQTAGTNLSENDRGLWGGLLILGKAPVSVDGDGVETQIEGIPASDTNGLYGGTVADDNSGTYQYISIRHGGAVIGEGNEINGLTLGGVGSGTTIDHIEVVGNVDDGVEFFGGTVNLSSFLAWAGGDDGLDIDQAYAGTISNSVVIEGEISDHATEIDGGEGSMTAAFTMTDVTFFGLDNNAADGEVADLRDGAMGTLNNILVVGFTGIGPDLSLSDVELDNADTRVADNYTNGSLVFSNWQVVLPTGISTSAEIFDDTTDTSTFEADAASFSSAVPDLASATVGADLNEFEWTYAFAKGAFEGY